jgi:hypothetical protein
MESIRWAVAILLVSASVTLATSQTKLNRFEIGQQYSFFGNSAGDLKGQHLLGGRLDIRVSRHLWLSSQVETGVTEHPPVSSIDGGRILLGCFGTKVGTQRRRLGIFGELRGGFLSWSNEVRSVEYLQPPFIKIHFGRGVEPLLNFGGAVEIYAKRRLGFRASVGDTVVFYRPHRFNDVDPPFRGFTRNNVHISAGWFFRF